MQVESKAIICLIADAKALQNMQRPSNHATWTILPGIVTAVFLQTGSGSSSWASKVAKTFGCDQKLTSHSRYRTSYIIAWWLDRQSRICSAGTFGKPFLVCLVRVHVTSFSRQFAPLVYHSCQTSPPLYLPSDWESSTLPTTTTWSHVMVQLGGGEVRCIELSVSFLFLMLSLKGFLFLLSSITSCLHTSLSWLHSSVVKVSFQFNYDTLWL